METAAPARIYASAEIKRGTDPLAVKESSSLLRVLGVVMFTLLMAYPLVVRYIPEAVRQYLSASLR